MLRYLLKSLDFFPVLIIYSLDQVFCLHKLCCFGYWGRVKVIVETLINTFVAFWPMCFLTC